MFSDIRTLEVTDTFSYCQIDSTKYPSSFVEENNKISANKIELRCNIPPLSSLK